MKKYVDLLLFAVIALGAAGCSTVYKHNVLANKIVFSDHDFKQAWRLPRINADCRVIVNCADKFSCRTDSLFVADKFEYPLNDIFFDIFSNMRDRALRPNNRGEAFEVQVDVQEAQLEINESFFSKNVRSKFRLVVLIRLFDPKHNRLMAVNLSSVQEENNLIKNKNEFNSKVSNVIYRCCQDITAQFFKKISEDNVIVRELKKFD